MLDIVSLAIISMSFGYIFFVFYSNARAKEKNHRDRIQELKKDNLFLHEFIGRKNEGKK